MVLFFAGPVFEPAPSAFLTIIPERFPEITFPPPATAKPIVLKLAPFCITIPAPSVKVAETPFPTAAEFLFNPI